MPSLLAALIEQLIPLYEHVDVARENALSILMHITSLSRIQLLLSAQLELSAEQQLQLQAIIASLLTDRKPLQYILGEVPFCNLTISVNEPLLVPRPETEMWVSDLIQRFSPYHNQQLAILDLCTGTGCIALALAHAFPRSTVVAVDISPIAIKCTQKNAARNSLHNITTLQSDLFAQLPQHTKFDLIVSNPPYISETEWHALQPEVKKWEDYHALVADDNGTALIKKIIEQAPAFLNRQSVLNNQPQLYIEIGNQQAAVVMELMRTQQFTPYCISDISGHDRVVQGSLIT